MNIFYLSHDPIECAQMHNDKHCVKMILEYAQLLSTAHRVLSGTNNVLDNPVHDAIMYKATHINHPSAIWVRQSRDNYAWLYHLLDALCKEYTYRYSKIHKVEKSGLLDELWFVPFGIPEHPKFTEPTPAMPDEVKVAGDSITSYRNYYNKHKTHLASWKYREEPIWYGENV